MIILSRFDNQFCNQNFLKIVLTCSFYFPLTFFCFIVCNTLLFKIFPHLNIFSSDRPVCQETEISHRYGQERDAANVTCNLSAYPSDVTFYWTLRNSSSNHSWSTGQVSHTRVELQKSSSELLCWGRNEIGVQTSPCRVLLAAGNIKCLFFCYFYCSFNLVTHCRN